MDFIYSKAYLGIITIPASAASSPIPGVQKGTRYQSKDYSSSSGMKVEIIQLDFYRTLYISTYEQRGWTYQERIMPKRCLFFTNHKVFFVCHLGTKDATFYAESKPEDGVRKDHNNDTISQFNSFRLSGSNDLNVILPGVWLAIEHYTSRQLLYSFDTLNAFPGIMSIAGNMFGLTFIYGLLEQSFDAALLWFPQVSSSKRNPDVPSWSWAGWIGEVAF
jgi:hypothetical protein